MQNSAVVLSALSALVSLQSHQGSVFFWAGAACTIGVGSISSIGAQGSTLSVEKEWTVVLCNGNSAALAKVNSGITSALLAPCYPIPVHVV
jgi:iron-regulated transporter 1